MNDIIKDPNNIRKGEEWLDMMPIQLQKRWLFYTSKLKDSNYVLFLLNDEDTFFNFILASFPFSETEEGVLYWAEIAEGNFGVIQKKKSLWSKIFNFFKL